VTVVNIAIQYKINAWHRAMFDAIEHKDGGAVWTQSLIFLPLTVANVALAVAALWTRLTTQRPWRAWLNGYVLDRWLDKGATTS
jgi:putative ATP-binding cassette transporter